MNNQKSSDFFWPSYVDLMTSLFAITLVLFVISYITLKRERDKFEVLAKEYQKIIRIQNQVKELEKKGFAYDSIYQRFLVKELTGKEIFLPNSTVIKQEFIKPALNAGVNIRSLLKKFQAEKKTRFLVVVEGNVANNEQRSIPEHHEYGYNLSYKRSLALVTLWRQHGITFEKSKAEIIIAGSGQSGVGRDNIEANNKRFLIQIIPKTDK